MPDKPDETDLTPDAEAPGVYDPSANPAKCKADGYFYCTVENRCLPTTLQEAGDIQKQGGCGGSGGSGSGSSGGGYNGTSMGGKVLPYPGYKYEDRFRNSVPHDEPEMDDEGADDDSRIRSGRAAIPVYDCSSICALPIPHYEGLSGETEEGRLLSMRDGYNAALACYGVRLSPKCTKGMVDSNIAVMQDVMKGIEASLTTINNALINIHDAVPTSPGELMGTYLGEYRDALSKTTRRSRPMGTSIQELDTFNDFMSNIPANPCTGAPAIKTDCPLSCTPPAKDFEVDTKDDIKDPNFDGIKYTPSKETKDPKYSKSHTSCLNDLPCTYEDLEHPKLDLEEDPEKGDMVDMDLSNDHITSGCANGDGLFDLLMTAVDSSIDLQFKASRLDAKQFGEFYASVIGASMQTATSFLVQKEQLKLDAEKINLEREKYDLFLDRHKYEKQLTKLSAEKAVLEMEVLKKKLPLDLALTAQQVKSAEKQIELTARKIESEEATTKSTYKAMEEKTLDGVLNRNLTEAKIMQTRVGIRTAKFDAILKKYQAYSTKVQTEEAKANGASSRRMTNADIQSKNKQASLYDQQRKTYIHGQRNDTMKLLKDMWTIQIDTLGAEGMVIEALKGPELSSKIERLSLDTGL